MNMRFVCQIPLINMMSEILVSTRSYNGLLRDGIKTLREPVWTSIDLLSTMLADHVCHIGNKIAKWKVTRGGGLTSRSWNINLMFQNRDFNPLNYVCTSQVPPLCRCCDTYQIWTWYSFLNPWFDNSEKLEISGVEEMYLVTPTIEPE